MPELPEVQTTAKGLQKVLPRLIISDVWTDYGGTYHIGKQHIKNKKYFETFKKGVRGVKFISASRKGKNVLLNLSSGKTIVVHMKMTGHLLYGTYSRNSKSQDTNSKKENKRKEEWRAVEEGPLQDSFNQFIHLVLSLSNGKHLVLSDMRKFARVTLVPTKHLDSDPDLAHLGPDPLSQTFDFEVFEKQLMMKKNGKIKQVLLDQGVISGIGNIYSDEILWTSDVHPFSQVSKIPEKNLKKMFGATKEILKKGIDFGGDSMSDYRNPEGLKGKFQYHHHAYRKMGEACEKRNCHGTITRIKVGGRSAHFCNKHQMLYSSD